MLSDTLYMAYNHNGTHLMKEGTPSRKKAEAEAREYSFHTGNAAYVEQLDENGEERE